MRARSSNLAGEVHEAVKLTAKAYLVAVSDLTPVDTGAALSNWQVGINSSPSGALQPHFPGKYRSTALENLARTIQIGSEIIDASSPGSVIHIANNIHYIGDLNDGTSSQAPTGMTDIAYQVASRVPGQLKVVKPR